MPLAEAQDPSSEDAGAGVNAEEQPLSAEVQPSADPAVVNGVTSPSNDQLSPRLERQFVPKSLLAEDQSPPRAKLTAPDVYLLPDQTGKLRKVLGFRYEDFMEAWNRRPGEQLFTPPRYVLDRWRVEGAVRETLVQVDLELQVTVQEEAWVDIPIQMPELIVQEIVIGDQRAGECLVFDDERFGYVLWLSGKAGNQREISVKGLAKLTASATDASLKLHLPRANATEFRLQVPKSATNFQTTSELEVEIDEQTEESTEIRLVGQANPMQLTWKTQPSSTRSENSLMVAEEATTIQVDRRRATYRSKLLVNSFQRPLREIRVRLPKRSTLQLTGSQGRYDVKELASTGDKEYRMVEISLPEASREPWSFDLVAEAPIEAFGDVAECGLEGFKVVDAFQQSGVVTVEVDDQLLAYLDMYGEVEQVPVAAETTASQGRSILGQFRYARFPWQLVVFSSPRQRRVSVKPTYDLSVNEDEARLNVQYDYQLTGAQIFSMRMNLNGWQRTDAPIESGGTIDPNSVVERRDGKLAFRLVDPSTPQLTLKMSFRKDLRLGENTFFFPEPTEAYLVDGLLRVTPAEPLKLQPKLDESVGLSVLPESLAEQPEESEPAKQRAKEQLRLRTFLPQPKLVAAVVQREQEVSARVQTQVGVGSQAIKVRQDLSYQSKFKPASQLVLQVPSTLWDNPSLLIALDGVPLETTPEETADEVSLGNIEPSTPGRTLLTKNVVVTLPRPMQNQIPLVVTYEMPSPALKAEELESLRLPFALPRDEITDHVVKVESDETVQVAAGARADLQSWEVLSNEGLTENKISTLTFRALGAAPFLDLYAQLDSLEDNQIATLERAWFQSWFALDRRQERAVFRFHTPGSKAFVQLPVELEKSEIELLLDGVATPFDLIEENRLAFSIPSPDVQQSRTLELRYQTPASLPSFGRLLTRTAQLEGQVGSAPLYYQLILPQGWQVTAAPQQLIPDYRLGWRHYRWGRQPTLSQANLEQHTGAQPTMAPPPLANQYVFRAFEMPAELQFTIVRQIWLTLAAALACFGVGLVCIYTSVAKHAYTWLLLGLVLLIGVSRFPAAIILVVQLILVGALMTLAAYILRGIFVIPRNNRLPTTTSMRIDPSEITAPWQEKVSVEPAFNESTTALKTGEPTP